MTFKGQLAASLKAVNLRRSGQRASKLQVVVAFVLTLHIALPIAYFIVLVQHGPVQNDWAHLKRVADHFVAGDTARLYDVGPGGLHPDYFWRYPPFDLYVIAPLAWLSPIQAYLILAGLGIAGWVYGCIRLRRLLTAENDLQYPIMWFSAIALSAPVLSTAVTGQSGGLLVLLLVAALTRFVEGRRIAGWLLLGLLALKPNWGIFFGVYALFRREYLGAASVLFVTLLLCVASLPLGESLWHDFFANALSSFQSTSVNYPYYKLASLKGWLNSLFGDSGTTVWIPCVCALVWVAAKVWRGPASEQRKFSAAVLLLVAANPYFFFYDALVLLIPASVWWAERRHLRPWANKAIGSGITIVWLWEHAATSWPPVIPILEDFGDLPFSLVGPLCCMWLAIEGVHANIGRAVRPEST